MTGVKCSFLHMGPFDTIALLLATKLRSRDERGAPFKKQQQKDMIFSWLALKKDLSKLSEVHLVYCLCPLEL